MDAEKLFNDLESNQSHECEEAKKKLVELFNQTKDIWLVHEMMNYFFKTGSLRIMEVLVKVQSPHDIYIFDRLSEWLKSSTHRVQALTLFSFVVRKHPTWLHKIEKHKIIWDMLKLLKTEKEIVSLMSALLCIVTLLPIIPMNVSTFLNDLFEVFGHLATWNSQNPTKLSDDKLVHLQLGLQMLFHRLYGMYPNNFLSYLSEFTKKEKGAIFQHTIKPLLDTVRVHPMLVTASTEIEKNAARWKNREPHDVVQECAKLSVTDQELHTEYVRSHDPSISMISPPQQLQQQHKQSIFQPQNSITYSGFASPFQSLTDREHFSDLKKGDVLWSPYTEIISSASTMPHTPTPSYGVPMSSVPTTGTIMGGVTGSSPPEAAVEATPETTPMKELTMKPSANQHAVCAIFNTSQPASPMRRDPQTQFTFPDSPGKNSNHHHDHTTFNKIPTKLYDKKIQHILNDRFNAAGHPHAVTLSPLTVVNSSNNGTPQFDSQEDEEVRDLTRSSMALLRVEAAAAAAEDIAKRCLDCDETEQSPCSEGGVQVATNRSMRILIRRNRFPSYCHNDSSWNNHTSLNDEMNGFAVERAKVRRAKSCPSLTKNYTSTNIINTKKENPEKKTHQMFNSKLTALSTGRSDAGVAVYRKQSCTTHSRVTQTIQTWPRNYEYTLFHLISENNKLRNESNAIQPQELLNQYINRTVKLKDTGYRLDQEHIQLLCLQLQYEQYRREIHAERNRRLMGRSRDIHSLEREQERLKESLKTYEEENQQLLYQFEMTRKLSLETERKLKEELKNFKIRYQEEVEHNKILQSTNENLQMRLNDEIQKRIELTCEVDSLRGQLFDTRNELQHAQLQADVGQQCKNELVRLESEFLVMGEVQIKLRDRLSEVDNLRVRDEEINHLQESYNIEIKDLRRALEEKTSQFDSAKHRLVELQTQVVNSEKVVTDQKRLLKTVKDEYEEKLKALNTKYEAEKVIILQMEEALMYLYRNQAPVNLAACSPDTDKTDIASSIERNSPLSTSFTSSDSLPASLRSVTEIRNLQAFVEPPNTATATITTSSGNSVVANIPFAYMRHSQHDHHHPSIGMEAKAVIAADGSSEATAASSSTNASVTHTLDIPMSAATKSHQQQQKQKPIPQNPRTKRSFE